MLGMMNAPSDSVEFYAVNRKNSDSEESEQMDCLTQHKQRDVITYTDDGRKMINGKLISAEDQPSMWGETLMRGAVRCRVLDSNPSDKKRKSSKKGDGKGEEDETEKNDGPKKGTEVVVNVDNVNRIVITDVPVLAKSPPKQGSS